MQWAVKSWAQLDLNVEAEIQILNGFYPRCHTKLISQVNRVNWRLKDTKWLKADNGKINDNNGAGSKIL